MATLTLAAPLRVGDLVNGITVDKLDLVSVAVNFQGASAIVSVMLRHAASGWTHTLTLTGADGDGGWAALKAALPNFERQILNLLAAKLPSGTIT